MSGMLLEALNPLGLCYLRRPDWCLLGICGRIFQLNKNTQDLNIVYIFAQRETLWHNQSGGFASSGSWSGAHSLFW